MSAKKMLLTHFGKIFCDVPASEPMHGEKHRCYSCPNLKGGLKINTDIATNQIDVIDGFSTNTDTGNMMLSDVRPIIQGSENDKEKTERTQSPQLIVPQKTTTTTRSK